MEIHHINILQSMITQNIAPNIKASTEMINQDKVFLINQSIKVLMGIINKDRTFLHNSIKVVGEYQR